MAEGVLLKMDSGILERERGMMDDGGDDGEDSRDKRSAVVVRDELRDRVECSTVGGGEGRGESVSGRERVSGLGRTGYE